MEKKRGRRRSDQAEIVFKGVVPLRNRPPLSHTVHKKKRKDNDLVWPLARAAVSHDLRSFLIHW